MQLKCYSVGRPVAYAVTKDSRTILLAVDVGICMPSPQLCLLKQKKSLQLATVPAVMKSSQQEQDVQHAAASGPVPQSATAVRSFCVVP